LTQTGGGAAASKAPFPGPMGGPAFFQRRFFSSFPRFGRLSHAGGRGPLVFRFVDFVFLVFFCVFIFLPVFIAFSGGGGGKGASHGFLCRDGLQLGELGGPSREGGGGTPAVGGALARSSGGCFGCAGGLGAWGRPGPPPIGPLSIRNGTWGRWRTASRHECFFPGPFSGGGKTAFWGGFLFFLLGDAFFPGSPGGRAIFAPNESGLGPKEVHPSSAIFGWAHWGGGRLPGPPFGPRGPGREATPN